MDETALSLVYLCPRCLLASDTPGSRPRCGQDRPMCCPCGPDDACRRPLMDAAGQERTRAPLWWLRLRVGPLLESLERS